VHATLPFSKEAALALLHARGTHVTVAVLPRPDLVDDTLYPQVRKAARAVADELSRSDFAVLGEASAADASSVVIVVELAHPRRPQVRVQDGPPAGIDRVGHFLEKWGAKGDQVLQGPYVRPDGSLGVDARRAERDAEAVLRAAFPRLSLGKDLTPKEAGPCDVRTLGEAAETPALAEALRALLARRLPWLDDP
jgi:tRNA nucleotidyltransferase (CCA-adding enzyme)